MLVKSALGINIKLFFRLYIKKKRTKLCHKLQKNMKKIMFFRFFAKFARLNLTLVSNINLITP